MAYVTASDLDGLVQHTLDLGTATLLIDRASGAVDGYVRKPLAEDTYTETFTKSSQELSPDRTRLWVVPPGWPLSVSAVVEDGATLTAGDYLVEPDGKVVRIDADGQRQQWGDIITATYTTGFAAGSFELQTAERIVLEIAAEAAANPQNLDSFSADGVSMNFRRGHGALSLAKEHRDQLHPLKWRRRWA